jgi:TolB-like protein/DNA-binding winged helix-turn-helix (wHTH) protein/Tfp pilus assembly protein PilF
MAVLLPSRKLTFGVFEAHPSAGKLLKNGISIKLPPQPFKVLLLLIEGRGKVVTREEIREYLWGAATFVDFERGINFSINQIRGALSDDVDKPRYIETLPKIGYRFLAEVEEQNAYAGNGRGSTTLVPDAALPEPSANEAGFRSTSKRGHPYLYAIVATIVLGIGVFAWRLGHRPVSPVQAVAVLPLEDLSGNTSQEYLADGVTDQLITDLGQVSSLRVISRTSVMQYKHARRPLPQIAKELNADLIVEGTIVRAGDRVRITAQLIEARTDRHLWAHTYETEIGDVLAMQKELAEVIADEVRSKITPGRRAPKRSVRSLPPAAQDAYLRGYYLLQKGRISDLPGAILYFEQSLASEPNAQAYAGSAAAHVALGHMMYYSPQQTFPAAKTAALKALELDENLEEAHTALGNVKLLYDWDFAGAEKEFKLALELNPSSVRAYNSYADLLSATSHFNEAIERAQQGLEMDPLSLSATTSLAWQFYRARRYDEAIVQAKKVAEIDPSYFPAHVCLGLAYQQQGNFPAAIQELKNASGFCREQCFGLIGQVSAMAGDRPAALEAMRQLQRRDYASPWLVATIYAQLNDKDRAFDWLQKAYEGREHDLVFANAWPLFDNLRSDQRYEQLLYRIGLPRHH